MTRNFSQSRFLSSDIDSEPDADPRVGLVNLADVMLVFACGLMLALVAYWNLDVSSMSEVVQASEVTEVQDVEQIEENASAGGGFVELGKVYQDPMTGKFYMLQEDMDKSRVATDGEESGEEDGNGNTGNTDKEAER
ncbi:MAG: DUF2149 domain-containing protein [Clostridiales Family XIII bacterium]|jgi:hypothetical protein|nr:DUF2149 domain-containing protein [Clostridiales Family XIII bacterium]